MVERTPILDVLTYTFLMLGICIVGFPIFYTFVAATLPLEEVAKVPMPLIPGDQFWVNIQAAWAKGHLGRQLMNSFIMASGITIGKICVSMLGAFSIVYFDYRFRKVAFAAVFCTLMLPVEVRILPTYKVTADLGMLNSYSGLIFPLIASATATFLFRQFFMTVPDELCEAARIDGAGPWRFFFDILLPMSRTSIAALFVILFIYGWNQYLWPLLITTDESYYTLLIGIKRMLDVGEGQAEWQIIMAASMLAMIPPVLVVVFMQKQFVRGMIETEK